MGYNGVDELVNAVCVNETFRICILVIKRLPAIIVTVIIVDDGPFLFSGLTLFSITQGPHTNALSLRSGTDKIFTAFFSRSASCGV